MPRSPGAWRRCAARGAVSGGAPRAATRRCRRSSWICRRGNGGRRLSGSQRPRCLAAGPCWRSLSPGLCVVALATLPRRAHQRVAGRAAGGAVPRAGRAGARDVSVALRVRHGRARSGSSPPSTRRRRRRSATIYGAASTARSIRSTRCPTSPSSSAGLRPRSRRSSGRSRSGRAPTSRYRLTSAVELYGADGRLVSRFALNLPEYTTPRHEAASCEWEVFEEVLPFGSSERHVPQASRGICDRGVVRGCDRRPRDARLPDAAVHLVAEPVSRVAAAGPRSAPPKGLRAATSSSSAYGWSRAPLFASGTSIWPLPDDALPRAWSNRASRSGRRRPRRRHVPRLLPERPRRHLRARLPGHHLRSAIWSTSPS